MRSCRPFTSCSSRDDVKDTQIAMDESATPDSLLAYESALVRSEEEKNVLHGLDYLLSNKSLREHEQRVQTEYLTALAYYRLRKDNECLKRIKMAEGEGVSSAEITAIKEALLKEQQKQKQEEIATGVGIGATVVVGIAAIASAIFFGTRRNRK